MAIDANNRGNEYGTHQVKRKDGPGSEGVPT